LIPGWAVPAFRAREYEERRTRFSVVVPVLNEGDRIIRQLDRMLPFSELADIVIADGNSSDGALQDELLERSRVRAVLIKTGPGGLSAQLRMGMAWSLDQGYEGVITIDGNNKDDPAGLRLMVDRLKAGFDFVQGSRFVRGGVASNTPLGRLAAIRLVHAPLTSLGSRRWWSDSTNGFRAHSRRFLEDPRVQPFREVFVGYELLAYLPIRAGRLGFRTTEVPVSRSYPESGAVPTKILGLRGNFELLRVLVASMLGSYDPRS